MEHPWQKNVLSFCSLIGSLLSTEFASKISLATGVNPSLK